MVVATVDGGPNLRDRIVESASTLPIANQATLWRVAELCRDSSTDARDVALEAQADEGFAAMLLRLANSAWSASSGRIGDLQTAVARLGLHLVENLALATPGIRLANAGDARLAAPRRRLHRHAVRTGLAARAIARYGIDADQALAAGLVHNIGLTVLSVLEPALFGILLDAAARGARLREVEEAELGFTHAELGGLLAERWSYPLPLTAVILGHDDDQATGMAAAVRVADLLSREAGVGIEPVEPFAPELLEEARIDLEEARERLAPLFGAEERLDTREEPAHVDRDSAFASALDAAAA